MQGVSADADWAMGAWAAWLAVPMHLLHQPRPSDKDPVSPHQQSLESPSTFGSVVRLSCSIRPSQIREKQSHAGVFPSLHLNSACACHPDTAPRYVARTGLTSPPS